ncbi:hypothetical protein COBT_000699 [Conglomerata obtusa]
MYKIGVKCTTTFDNDNEDSLWDDFNFESTKGTLEYSSDDFKYIGDAFGLIESDHVGSGGDSNCIDCAIAINNLKFEEISHDSNDVYDLCVHKNQNFSDHAAVESNLNASIDTNNSNKAKENSSQNYSNTKYIKNSQNGPTQNVNEPENDASQAVKEQQNNFNIINSPIEEVNDLNSNLCFEKPHEESGIHLEVESRNLLKQPRHSFDRLAIMNKVIDKPLEPHKMQTDSDGVNTDGLRIQTYDSSNPKIDFIIDSKHTLNEPKNPSNNPTSSHPVEAKNSDKTVVCFKKIKPIPVILTITNGKLSQIWSNDRAGLIEKNNVYTGNSIHVDLNKKKKFKPGMPIKIITKIKPPDEQNFVTENQLNRIKNISQINKKTAIKKPTITNNFCLINNLATSDNMNPCNITNLSKITNKSNYSEIYSKLKAVTNNQKLDFVNKNLKRSMQHTSSSIEPNFKKIVTRCEIQDTSKAQYTNIFPVCKMCQMTKKALKIIDCNIKQNKPYRFVSNIKSRQEFQIACANFYTTNEQEQCKIMSKIINLIIDTNKTLPKTIVYTTNPKNLFILYKISGDTKSDGNQVSKLMPFIRYFLVNSTKECLELKVVKKVLDIRIDTAIERYKKIFNLCMREVYACKDDIQQACTHNFVDEKLISFLLNLTNIAIFNDNDRIYSISYENFYRENLNCVIKDQVEQQIIHNHGGNVFLEIHNIFNLVLTIEEKTEDILYQNTKIIEAIMSKCSIVIDIPEIVTKEIVDYFVDTDFILSNKEENYAEFLKELNCLDTFMYDKKYSFIKQLNGICKNFAKLDFNYTKIVGLLNTTKIDPMCLDQNLNVSALQQYFIKYTKSLDHENPIHVYISELQFFDLYLKNNIYEKGLYVSVQELVEYLNLLYIFTIISKSLVPINFSQLSVNSTCEFNMFLHHPIRLIFMKIRYELQRIFAHIISIFVSERCFELFVEKYLTERLFFTFFDQNIECEKPLARITVFGKKSNWFILSRLFFLFAIKDNLFFEPILRSPSFDKTIIFFLTKNTCNSFTDHCLDKSNYLKFHAMFLFYIYIEPCLAEEHQTTMNLDTTCIKLIAYIKNLQATEKNFHNILKKQTNSVLQTDYKTRIYFFIAIFDILYTIENFYVPFITITSYNIINDAD